MVYCSVNKPYVPVSSTDKADTETPQLTGGYKGTFMVYISNVRSLFKIYLTDETNFTFSIFQDILMWFISYAPVSGELYEVHTGIH